MSAQALKRGRYLKVSIIIVTLSVASGVAAFAFLGATCARTEYSGGPARVAISACLQQPVISPLTRQEMQLELSNTGFVDLELVFHCVWWGLKIFNSSGDAVSYTSCPSPNIGYRPFPARTSLTKTFNWTQLELRLGRPGVYYAQAFLGGSVNATFPNSDSYGFVKTPLIAYQVVDTPIPFLLFQTIIILLLGTNVMASILLLHRISKHLKHPPQERPDQESKNHSPQS